MLILYSVFFNDSIGIFIRYPCLKIMSVFDITLNYDIVKWDGLKIIMTVLLIISNQSRVKLIENNINT